MTARVGVVLSGCGVMDGSEIHEAAALLIALDRRGAKIQCVAPDIAQRDVINHLTGKPEKDTRNVLEESARIARGKVKDIASVAADDFDALIFPGGYGAAKNLSSFAVDGANCTVQKDVEKLFRDMHAQGKPIGLACISPVIAAKLLGQREKPKLTLGSESKASKELAAMGAHHVPAGETDVVVDEENHLVSTPCYMNDVGPWVVYQGAERLVEAVMKMAGDTAAGIRSHMASPQGAPHAV